MIKVYCDCCKEPIENFGDQVTVGFNNCLIDSVDDEYHFHTACAVRVRNILEDFLSRPVQDEKEDEERKHGKWIVLAEFADKSICTECSICGEEYTYKKGRIGNFVHNCYAKYNYCPNCGAKMDLKAGAEK